MAEGVFVFSLLSLTIVPFLAHGLLRNTILDVTDLRNNPWPLLWYFSLVIVLVPLVIVSAAGIENVPTLYRAIPGTEGTVALSVIFSLIAYIASLAFFLRVFKVIRPRPVAAFAPSRISNILYALALLGSTLLLVFYLFGYKHAFLFSLIEGRRLIDVRLANKYISRVPSQIAAILPLIGYFQAALAGYLARISRLKSLVFLVIALLFLTAPGDKAPPIWGIVIWFLGGGIRLRKRLFSLKSLVWISAVSALGLLAVYFVTSLQWPEMTKHDFLNYLLMRLGIGQMAGVYETFGLLQTKSLPEGDFYLHMIPGASFFVDYIDYQKALMMITEGYGYSEMGVKNTLFIAEALAIGGIPLMLLSPIVVGFSTSLGLFVLIRVLRQIVGKDLAYSIALVLYLRTHDITGGFAGFPLFKGLFLLLAHIFVIWLWCWFFVGCKKVFTLVRNQQHSKIQPKTKSALNS